MNFPGQKKIILIAGPTAVGKTSVAIAVAKHFQTEIISADSRQCFKELNIGVARPSARELSEVKHHFIASHTIEEEVTAAVFENYALEKAEEIFRHRDLLVMAGGTGLYIRAFCEGLDEIPGIAPEIRLQIADNYSREGLSWLQSEIEKKDPAFFVSGEIKNPQRMMRALEVMESTGRSILEFRKGAKAERNFSIIKIGLELPREELYRNINHRVDEMIRAGLVEEVKNLVHHQELNALQTVGYQEIFEYLKGNMLLYHAVEKIKMNTRRYAKRQMTWFRKDAGIKWFHPGETNAVIDFVQAGIRF
jgi:tRNA dimethylallyltransferase